MADSAFKTQVSRDENANSASNVLFIQLADNAGNSVSVTGGKLDVNAVVSIETAYVDDSAFVVGTDKVNAQGYLADETTPDSVNEGDIGIARMTLDRKVLMVIADPTTDANRLGIDASGYITSNINGTVTIDANSSNVTIDNAAGAAAVNIQDGGNSITVDGTVAISGTVAVTQSGTWNIATVTTLTGITNDVSIDDGGNSITVDAVDLDIRDLTDASDKVAIGDGTDTLAVNTDGSINVAIVPTAGTRVHDYKTASPAAGASDNHDYTVAGTTFELNKIAWGGSGKEKVEVQVGPLAGLVTKYSGFSEKDTPGEMEFVPAILVPATSTGTVRLIVTNRQGSAVSVYSTIMGTDIA